MIKLHYGKVLPASVTATTAAAGYPALNVASESLARPWRATGVGATDVTWFFSAQVAVESLHLHDVNFASATVLKSADGVAFNAIAGSPLVTYMGRESRRRGVITVADAAVKALRVSIPGGGATDGLPYWRIGSGPVFASSLVVPTAHEFGYAHRFVYPQARAGLANGQEAIASTGFGFHLIEVPFRPEDTQDLEPLVRRARAGTVLLDLGMANYPWQVWPARLDEPELLERFDVPKASELSLIFREVV